MKQPVHTPAPWYYTLDENSNIFYVGHAGPDGSVDEVARIEPQPLSFGRGATEANAVLIAAAPDLLAAAINVFRDATDREETGEKETGKLYADWQALSDAIEKAGGEA